MSVLHLGGIVRHTHTHSVQYQVPIMAVTCVHHLGDKTCVHSTYATTLPPVTVMHHIRNTSVTQLCNTPEMCAPAVLTHEPLLIRCSARHTHTYPGQNA